MSFSEQAKNELLQFSLSSAFMKDMQKVSLNTHNPFWNKGKVSADAYIEFVCQFNEFINHARKPFTRLIEKDMKL